MTSRQPLQPASPARPSARASLARASLARASLAAVGAALLASAAATPAQALDDGSENIFKSLTNAIGFGLFSVEDDDKPRINYRERAPLVVPPNLSQLPAPAPRAAERNQAWPQDADVTRRQQAQERNRRPRDTADQPMSVEEQRRGRTLANNQTEPAPAGCGEGGLERLCDPTSFWGKLRDTRSSNADNPRDLVAGQEPARRALTDPPRGLRTPTQAVKYTFEARREVDASDPRAQLREEVRRRDAMQRGENVD